MAMEKDYSFKYIGENYLSVLLDLAEIPEDMRTDTFEDVTSELGNLDTMRLRPDLIIKNSKLVIMMEYESSYVDTSTKKRFHAYVTLYDYYKNHENLDIYFFVITSKEKSKIASYRIDDIDEFRFKIINIRDLDFEKIINNTKSKIKNNEEFMAEDSVKLALTSLMPKTKEKNINQFYYLSDISKEMKFENIESKKSFLSLILVLSNIFFEKDDNFRKDLQSDIMNKIDCFTERIEEVRDEVSEEKDIQYSIKFLEKGFPIEDVSEIVDLPVEKLESEYEKFKIKSNHKYFF